MNNLRTQALTVALNSIQRDAAEILRKAMEARGNYDSASTGYTREDCAHMKSIMGTISFIAKLDGEKFCGKSRKILAYLSQNPLATKEALFADWKNT